MIETKTIEKAFTSSDLASYLGISTRSLDRYVRQGKLNDWRCVKIGKHVRFFPIEHGQVERE